MNKKILVAVLIVQFVLMAMFLVYGLVQRSQAIYNEELARRAQIEAENERRLKLEMQAAYEEELKRCMTHK